MVELVKILNVVLLVYAWGSCFGKHTNCLHQSKSGKDIERTKEMTQLSYYRPKFRKLSIPLMTMILLVQLSTKMHPGLAEIEKVSINIHTSSGWAAKRW
jgi:hypothetical protein